MSNLLAFQRDRGGILRIRATKSLPLVGSEDVNPFAISSHIVLKAEEFDVIARQKSTGVFGVS